jgi:Mor family transcriptional regulator
MTITQEQVVGKRHPGQPEKTERNQEVYNDWKSGMTYFDMRLKHKISENTIRRILLRYWAKFGHERAITNSK